MLANYKRYFRKIINNKFIDFNKLNINITFKIAEVKCLYLRKIIYIGIKLKKFLLLKIKITRFEVIFSKKNQYIIVYFEQNRINIRYINMQIIFAIIGENKWPIATLFSFYI